MKEEIQKMADQMIRDNPSKRIISFKLNDEKYWIKRKLGNGRNQLVKYSVEKEFYYEIARMTIARQAHPELVPAIEVLTPDYMVTKDGGPTLKNWLGSGETEEEKENLLEETGRALASLHGSGIVHGRPALRDITWKDGKLTFLDWENRLYSQDKEEQKAIDFLLLMQGVYRENYDQEKERVLSLMKGYRGNGGEDTIEAARKFLKKHSLIGWLTHELSPFHMKDIDSVRKLYELMT